MSTKRIEHKNDKRDDIEIEASKRCDVILADDLADEGNARTEKTRAWHSQTLGPILVPEHRCLSFEAPIGVTMILLCPMCGTEITLETERVRKTMGERPSPPIVTCPCGSVGTVQELNIDTGVGDHDGRARQKMTGNLLFTAGRGYYGVTAFPSEIPIIDAPAAIDWTNPPPPKPPPPDCFATSDELMALFRWPR